MSTKKNSITIEQFRDSEVIKRSEPGGRVPLDGLAADPVPGSPGRLRGELVDEAIDRARAGLPVGEVCDEIRERLTDGLIDELLAGGRSQQEVFGPGGLLGDLTRRLVERAMACELTGHLG